MVGAIVGNYTDSSLRSHGLLYTNWYTTLDGPSGAGSTSANGVSLTWTVTDSAIVGHTNVVGSYGNMTGTHDFLYNGSTYTTIDAPLGVNGTYANGISGNDIVGTFYDSSNIPHGFLVSLPEPSTLTLLTIAAASFFAVRFWRRRRAVSPRWGNLNS